jgi:hypothetical protein
MNLEKKLDRVRYFVIFLKHFPWYFKQSRPLGLVDIKAEYSEMPRPSTPVTPE